VRNAILRPIGADWISGPHGQEAAEPRQKLLGRTANWPVLLCIVLLCTYLIILPGGTTGYALAAAAFAASFFGVNSSTLGVFLLLSGPPIMGVVFQSLNISALGSIVSIPMGLIVLFSTGAATRPLALNWKWPALWLAASTLTLLLFYLDGPQTEYGQTKLVWFTINLLVDVTVVGLMVADRKINFWRLGMMCIAGAVVYCAALFYMRPEILPAHFWDTGGIRSAGSAETSSAIATNTVALVASSGVVLMIGALVDIRPRKYLAVATILMVAVGMMTLNLIGQRLFLLVPLLAVTALMACKPKDPRVIRVVLLLLLSGLVTVVLIGLAFDNELVTSIFASDANVDERLNRSINWQAAIERIQERPWLGYGLGGYFISGYSAPDGELYAHNLVLELLSETGIVGTLAILLTPVLFLWKAGRDVFMLRTISGASLTPFLAMAFAHAMISHDLRQSGMLLAVIAVLWARWVGPRHA
jgi:O-antigen ligase